MRRAIDADDQETLDRLQVTPPAQPVEKLKVVTLGVAKRVVPGAFASFDFRLRALGAAGPVADKEPLIWSCVFPLRKDLDLPAEAFLHLPQKQKFKPSILLEKKVVEVTKCAVSAQAGGATRLIAGRGQHSDRRRSVHGLAVALGWDMRQAAERLEQHRPTPMDLEIELQEEVFHLRLAARRTARDGRRIRPAADRDELSAVRSAAGSRAVGRAAARRDDRKWPRRSGVRRFMASPITNRAG